MSKKELFNRLSKMLADIQELHDDAMDGWRAAEIDSEDEEFFDEAADTLSELESTLSLFVNNIGQDDVPVNVDSTDLEDLDYEEMNEDPEAYFKKEMEK